LKQKFVLSVFFSLKLYIKYFRQKRLKFLKRDFKAFKSLFLKDYLIFEFSLCVIKLLCKLLCEYVYFMWVW